jgi:uncharacterized phage protein (TIGR02216 family)
LKAAAGAAQAFPWNDVMATGLGLLRLSPKTFWSMTPREFERAASTLPFRASIPPGRDALLEMMETYPDLPTEEEKHG